MNVLFVAAILPFPLYSGGQVRMYNLLKKMSAKHSITLLAFTRTAEEKSYLKNLSFLHKVHLIHRGRAWQFKYMLKALTSSYPFLYATYTSNEMRQLIAKEIATKSYDVLHIEPGYVYPAVEGCTLPLVVGEHNIEHQVYAGYAQRSHFSIIRKLLEYDVHKMQMWQKKIWEKAAQITSVSQSDSTYIEQYVPADQITLVSNGVDTKEISFKPHIFHEHPILLFVGNFSWIQNIDALEYLCASIWPLLKQKYPRASLHIVGRGLAKKTQESLPEGVTVLEHVDHIVDAYREADILLAPIRVGGGTKYKILEAMAAGLPVITTEKGIEGLHVRHKQEVLLVATPEEYVKAVEELYTDQVLTKKIIAQAKEHIDREYTWDIIAKKLDEAWYKAYEKRN